MLYDIRLSITHRYQEPATQCRHLIRVLPRGDIPGQRVLVQLVETTPAPRERYASTDFFGNAVLMVVHAEQHAEMDIRMSARVEIDEAAPFVDASPGSSGLTREIAACANLGPASPMHFLGPSPRLQPSAEIGAFARAAVDPGATTAQQVLQFGRALHDAMAFDATATTVETDAPDAFRQRRGVCQDFTHIMILGLRALGIPAAYVSGYLRTLSPPGAPRLEGADAMHAWVHSWCGAAQGWIAYDPTNATLATSDHIVVGYGRDYADVSPVIGHLRSSGRQLNTQSVDVRPIF